MTIDVKKIPFSVLYAVKLAVFLLGFNSSHYLTWWMTAAEVNVATMLGGGVLVARHRCTNMMDAIPLVVSHFHATHFFQKRKGIVSDNQAFLRGKFLDCILILSCLKT